MEKKRRPYNALTVKRFKILKTSNTVVDTWTPGPNEDPESFTGVSIRKFDSPELARAFIDGLVFCEYPMVWGAWETVNEGFERARLEKERKPPISTPLDTLMSKCDAITQKG